LPSYDALAGKYAHQVIDYAVEYVQVGGRMLKRPGFVGGSIPREDGPDGTTEQIFTGAA
jgi:hypothetical protein